MISVVGERNDVQPSIDFYMGITSVNCSTDSASLRRKFFSMFEEEDKDREENFLSYQEEITDDYKIKYTKKLILLDNEEIFDNNVSYFDVSSGKVITRQDLFENDKLPETVSVVSSPVSVSVEQPKEEYPEDSDVYSEIDDLIASSEMEEVDNTESSDDDFVEENYEEVDEQDTFSSWGSSESDEDIEVSEVDEDDDFIVQQSEGSEEPQEELFSSWGSPEEQDDTVEEVVEAEQPEVELPVTKEAMELDDFFASLDDCPEDVNIENVTKEVAEKVVSVEAPKREGIVTDVPSDLRDFIKMYPNCEMQFVLKYFNKKEIDKQLSLGRVFKRKNRLLI